MGTYYFSTDGDDGADGLSPATAFQTLVKIDNLQLGGLTGGDYLLFRRGDTFRGYIEIYNSGSAGNPITLDAYGSGDKPKIWGSKDYSSSGLWTNYSGSIWVTTNAVTTDTDVANLIFNNEAAYGVKKTTLVGLGSQGDWYIDPSDSKVYLYSSQNPGDWYSHIEIGGAYIGATQETILIDEADYITIRNLDVRYSPNNGIIFMYGCQHCIAEYNDVSWIGGMYVPSEYPVRMGNGIGVWQGGTDIIIRYNRINQCYDAGISPQGGDGYAEDNIQMYYNVITNCYYSFEWFTRDPNTFNNVNFYNNTCVNAGSQWSQGQRPSYGSAQHIRNTDSNTPSISNCHIKNNIFSTSVIRGAELGLTSAEVDCDNNLWYVNTMGDTDTGGPYNTLAQWQAATSHDTNSLSADPKFTSSTDFHLQSDSPAINAGIDVGLSQDFDGNSFVGNPDIGAYEYNGVPGSPTPTPSVSPTPGLSPTPTPTPSAGTSCSNLSISYIAVKARENLNVTPVATYDISLRFQCNLAGFVTPDKFSSFCGWGRTPTPTCSPTPPAVAFGIYSTSSYGSADAACIAAPSPTQTIFLTAGDFTPSVNDIFYLDGGYSNHFVGNNGWYYLRRSADRWACQIDSDGIIQGVQYCNDMPTPSPTPTLTPTPSLSITQTPSITITPSPTHTPPATPSPTSPTINWGVNVTTTYLTSSDCCTYGGAPDTTKYSIVGTDTLEINDYIYNDSACTQVFAADGNYYHFYKAPNYFAVQITNAGLITDVIDCSVMPSVSPTPSITPTITPSLSISATPTPSITITPSPTHSPPATPSPTSPTINWGVPTSNTYATSSDCCVYGGAPEGSPKYSVVGTDPLEINDYIYNDSACTIAFSADGNYYHFYKSPNYFAVQISAAGLVLDVINCNSMPSVSPTPSQTPSITPTPTPSLSISKTPSLSISATPSLSISKTPSITATRTPSLSISATPSLSISVTPSPTHSPPITPSPTLATVSSGVYTSGTYATDVLACGAEPAPDDTKYLAAGKTTPSVNDVFYNESNLSTVFVGNSQYYFVVKSVGVNYAIQINSSGVALDVTDCSSLPSPTPTPTRTPTKTPSLSISTTPSLSISATRTPSLSISKTPSLSISATPSRTPSLSISKTPSLSISATPSRTPSLSISRTPSRTPSLSVGGNFYNVDRYSVVGGVCDTLLGSGTINNATALTLARYYCYNTEVYYISSSAASSANNTTITSAARTTCDLAAGLDCS